MNRFQHQTKKTIIKRALLPFAAGLCLTGCGEGTTELEELLQTEQVEITAEPILSEAERAIKEYELKYASGNFSQEDYHALARLYQEDGQIKKQRDLLEESYRLYDDQEAFTDLQSIAVNLEEEEPEIFAEASLMLQNLELSEYLDESVNLIAGSEWLQTMMPKLYEGKRNYFLTRDGKQILFIVVGYDESGKAYSDVWYTGSEEQAKVLRYYEGTVHLMQTGFKDGTAEGDFTSWMCDGNTGDITREEGTLQGGILVGEYTVSMHSGDGETDLFALWSNRESMEYTVYTGEFDEQGKPTVEQPTEQQIKALAGNTEEGYCLVYAYDESKKHCLFQVTDKDVAEDYRFTSETVGWVNVPDFATYEVKRDAVETEGEDTSDTVSEQIEEQQEATEVPTVRIYDGQIQMQLYGIWVNVGSVAKYEKEDPFAVYAQSREDGESEAVTGIAGSFAKPTVGTIPEPEKPKPTTKPATSKPSTTTKTPEPDPEPTPEPTPAPAPSPAPSPSPAPAQNETPAQTETPSQSGDTDQEWTDDLL